MTTLDVIVERQITVAVFLQQTKCIVVSEVFKLYQSTLAVPTDRQTVGHYRDQRHI